MLANPVMFPPGRDTVLDEARYESDPRLTPSRSGMVYACGHRSPALHRARGHGLYLTSLIHQPRQQVPGDRSGYPIGLLLAAPEPKLRPCYVAVLGYARRKSGEFRAPAAARREEVRCASSSLVVATCTTMRPRHRHPSHDIDEFPPFACAPRQGPRLFNFLKPSTCEWAAREKMAPPPPSNIVRLDGPGRDGISLYAPAQIPASAANTTQPALLGVERRGRARLETKQKCSSAHRPPIRN